MPDAETAPLATGPPQADSPARSTGTSSVPGRPGRTSFLRLIDALEHGGQRVTGAGRQRMAQCPAHEDTNPSLSITDGNSRVLVKCQAGCDTGDVLTALGLTFADLGDERKRREPAYSVVAEYKYTDEHGELLFVKERRQPKDFRVRRPDGRGGWVWGLGSGTRRVLYRLPALQAAIAAGRTVYVVEGEKDADRLAALGEVATCNHDGAAKSGQRPKWRPEYGDTLRGADVVIVADRDDPGEGHARAIAADLSAKAKSVAVVQAAVTAPGADVSDHLDAGHTLAGLVPLADATTTTEPADPLPGIPSFPVDQVTGPLRSFVDWGISDGLHPECVAAAGLAALATLTGPARLKVSPVNVIKPILWIALAGIASSGKTPAYKHAFSPLRDAYDLKMQLYEDELAAWRETAESQGKEAAGRPPSRPQAHELDDTTTEAVARWLLARGPDTSGAIIDDELAAFLTGMNQYKGGQGSDLSRWLKMWAGAPLHIQRVGRGGAQNEVDLYVPGPVVSVSGPLVPENLYLLGKPSSGFRPRWLVFYAPGQPPQMLASGEYPADWTECIARLLASRGPREWNLAGESRTVWLAARKRWQEQQGHAEPDDVIEALRKADIQCLRVALVLADSASPGNGGDIPADAMTSAVAIIDYCINVWRCLPGNSTMTFSRREDVMDAAHRRLMAWLDSRPHGTEGLPEGSRPRSRANRRELQQWLHEPPAKIDELIDEHRRRWPGCVVDTKPPRGPSTKWIYAPERTHTPRPELLPLQFPDGVCTPGPQPDSAGQDVTATPAETVAGTVAPGVQQFAATVSPAGPTANGTSPWPPSETGPCTRCGNPCHRYGPGGAALCGGCKDGRPAGSPVPPAALCQVCGAPLAPHEQTAGWRVCGACYRTLAAGGTP